MIASLLLAVPIVAPIQFDRAAHTVTFTAHATKVEKGTTVEFAFVGPGSDRAYEAQFMTDATVDELTHAFEAAGIPCGQPVSDSHCRFWPAGKHMTITPSIGDYITTAEGSNFLHHVVYTGGERNAQGFPLAATNMPSAVFALYSLGQSLMLPPGSQSQSLVYGRFVSSGRAQPGERISFTVSWDGKSGSETRELRLEPGKIREALAALRKARNDLDVLPVFSESLTVREARAAAEALAVIDSEAVMLNGFRPDQFYYRGFLPDERWRDRQKRLTQPVEIRQTADGWSFTVIDEDWSVEGDDPKLTPRTVTGDDIGKSFKGDTGFFYVSGDLRLERIFALRRQLPQSIKNWYVYID